MPKQRQKPTRRFLVITLLAALFSAVWHCMHKRKYMDATPADPES